MPVARMTLTRMIGSNEAEFKVSHTNDGRLGTQLTFDLSMYWSILKEGTEFGVRWPSDGVASGKTPQEAVHRMATWLKRAGAALEQIAPLMGDTSVPISVVVDTGPIVFDRPPAETPPPGEQ